MELEQLLIEELEETISSVKKEFQKQLMRRGGKRRLGRDIRKS